MAAEQRAFEVPGTFAGALPGGLAGGGGVPVRRPGSHPADFTRPWGGLNVQGGRNCKYIHLVIHDCRQGVSFWSGDQGGELYGCVIYDNGWPATDRGHGHAVYTQNREGV